MSEQQLRDRNGKYLGKINTLASGRLEIRDPVGRLMGTYDPKTDQTKDPVGRLLGKGNQLASLLKA
jgi:hypothetical protein